MINNWEWSWTLPKLDQQLISKLNPQTRIINKSINVCSSERNKFNFEFKGWSTSWMLPNNWSGIVPKVELSRPATGQQVEPPTSDNQQVGQRSLKKLKSGHTAIKQCGKQLNLSWSTIDQHVEFVEINLAINNWSPCWVSMTSWSAVVPKVELSYQQLINKLNSQLRIIIK